LNDEQLEAVTATEGYVRVIAGAGSGKTRALAHRFAWLVNELGILPGNILCVTFTNKSAAEMRQRIHNLTGDNDTGYINTFHGFCVSVLQEDIHAAGYPKSFLVLDNSDIDAMLKTVYEERGLTLRNMTFSKARDMIEIQKLVKKPEYYEDLIRLSLEELKEKYIEAKTTDDIIFYGYLWQQKKCFGLDYNDLIKFTLYIFRENPEIRKKWQKRLEYIMIDEFQDIDALQYELMEVLAGYHGNLFVVGDPDQTIYTWRGANVKYLMDFEKNFPGTRTIIMMKNYRSTPQILAAANQLIRRNRTRIKKDLIPTLPVGPKVLCHHGETETEEAEWIASKMRQLSEAGVPYRHMTVLYRAHYVSRHIEEALLKEKIPYTIYSGVPFFERMEIKDALSYLRLIAYRDDLSFLRVANVPKRNLGRRRMAWLAAYAEQNPCSLFDALRHGVSEEPGLFQGTGAGEFLQMVERLSEHYETKPVSELLSEVLDQSGYEAMLRTEGSQQRLDNLAELKQSVHLYEISCGEECSLEHYLAHVALFTNGDLEDAEDKVKLMTVHTAKGLEFPYVFLCGMNEGIFPSRKTSTLQAMEEERRLAFVAVTRAEKALFLTEAEGRNFDGSPRYPSRFLLDMGTDVLEYDRKPADTLVEQTRSFVEAKDRFLTDEEGQTAFAPGQRVRHGIFGEGTILEIDSERQAWVIQFDQNKTPRTLTFRAKLEPLQNPETC
ncbi:MAG: ATP-dependent helicase, partial [Anaerovoracaceae bacterium]